MPSRRGGGGEGNHKGLTGGNAASNEGTTSASSATAPSAKATTLADNNATTAAYSHSTAGTKTASSSKTLAPALGSSGGKKNSNAESKSAAPKVPSAAGTGPPAPGTSSCSSGGGGGGGGAAGVGGGAAARTAGKRSSSGTRRTTAPAPGVGGSVVLSATYVRKNDLGSAVFDADDADAEYDFVEEEEDDDDNAVVAGGGAGGDARSGSDKDACLHCRKAPAAASASSTSPPPPADHVQVRCDECSAFICNDCHWCHEFQANHEIRVCDRCDAFYCKSCDEMDQCDDCGEVVCGGCSTLLSCKFCGGGLCEDCATACGRCGIVLCSRDAKFAVDCDTCRLSYCLVCLASGSKDPCVRCGHRPSKRMEQLVHLRLKSIYKAFKQTSHSSSGRSGGSSQHSGTSNYNGSTPTNTAASTNLRERQNDDPDELHVAENPDVLLQHAAASAAAKLKQGASAPSAHHSASSHHPRHGSQQQHANPVSASSGSAHAPTSNSSSFLSMSASERLELYMAEKAKADKAAADLLAELDEEEEQKKSKLSKKQKKKLKLQQEQQIHQKSSTDDRKSSSEERGGDDEVSDDADRSLNRRVPPIPSNAGGDRRTDDVALEEEALNSRAETLVVHEEQAHEPMEAELEKLIESEDVDGIESLLASVKGVPGLAVLRKNAKKALKRFRADHGEEADPPPSTVTPVEDAKPEVPSGVRITSSTKLRKSSTSGSENPNRVEWSMRVDPSIVGYVIGKGGLRIRELMEESGARIWVDQEGLGPNEQRMVCCSGHKKNVDAAIILILDVVEKAPASQVYSKLSNTAKAVDDASKQPSESHGTIKQRGKDAEDRVSPPAYRDPLKASHVLTCDPRFVPLLIGRRGWTIKNIQDSSGARVDIDQSVIPRRITVSGSEASVEVAVRMVRDVLSYPHSQLQGSAEMAKDDEDAAHLSPILSATPAVHQIELDQELDAMKQRPEPSKLSLSEAVSRGANSPPSSLIMTGDAKSTVSASSSLSSTPEPSMASSLPKGGYSQIPPGPMLPPAVGAPQYEPAPSDPSTHAGQPNPFLLPRESLSLGLPKALPVTSSTDMHVAMRSPTTPQPQRTVVGGVRLEDSVPQVESSASFSQPPGGILGTLAPSAVAPRNFPSSEYHNKINDPFAQSMMMNDHSSLSLTGTLGGQTDRWNGAGAQSLRLPDSSPAAVDSFRFDAAVEFLQSTKAAPSSSMRLEGDPVLLSAPLPQREAHLLGLGQETAAPGYMPTSNPAHADSQIVDSLFGPSTGTVHDETILLNSLQGLSLSKEYAQIGLWGASAPTVEEKSLVGLGPYLTADVRGNPMDLNIGDAPSLNVHHPPQSRFGW